MNLAWLLVNLISHFRGQPRYEIFDRKYPEPIEAFQPLEIDAYVFGYGATGWLYLLASCINLVDTECKQVCFC